MRTVSGKASKRTFTESVESRDVSSDVSRREFTASVQKRAFGTAVIGWRVWGQTNIYPFDYPTGVDSTKTFGELP